MVKKRRSPIIGAIEDHKKPTFLMAIFTPHTLQCTSPFVDAIIIFGT
jgi:hypothetical protein